MRQPASLRMQLGTLIAAFLFPSTAPALTVDPFEEGPLSVQVTNGTQIFATGGLSTVLGTFRRGFVQASGASNATASATLTLTAGDDGVSMEASNLGFLLLNYPGPTGGGNGLPQVDLTEGGTQDRILVEISSFELRGVSPVDLGVAIVDNGAAPTVVRQITSAGIVEFPFSEFTTDVTQATRIAVTLDGFNYGATISNIATVPEPGTAGLLLLGLSGLGIRRRRSQGSARARSRDLSSGRVLG